MRNAAGKALVAAAVLGAAIARAADPTPPPAPQYQPPLYELTPFAGFRLGGSFKLKDTGRTVELNDRGSFALALDLQADEVAQYELFYSRQHTALHGDSTLAPTSIDVEYLHIGGTALLDDARRVKSYVVGGIGVTRFTPPAQGTEDTRLSASLGLGLRVPVNRHLSVRLEARAFLTLVNSDTAIFCRSDQAGLICQIHGSGSTFLQGEVLAGVAFAL